MWHKALTAPVHRVFRQEPATGVTYPGGKPMRLLFGAAVVTASLVLAATVFAQSTSAPDSTKPDMPKADSKADSTAPVAANPGAAVPLPMGKRLSCETTTQSMSGQDRRDQMQLCMEQARLDCLKQAIDQKIVGPQRRDFVRDCAQ
jgi:hypothetical protein